MIKKTDLAPYITDTLTVEMREWLEENYSGKYFIRRHMVRFKYAGPSVPLEKCMRPQGWEIWFDNEAAMAFKLRWE